jgi:hypothetical protein
VTAIIPYPSNTGWVGHAHDAAILKVGLKGGSGGVYYCLAEDRLQLHELDWCDAVAVWRGDIVVVVVTVDGGSVISSVIVDAAAITVRLDTKVIVAGGRVRVTIEGGRQVVVGPLDVEVPLA